MRGYLDHAFLEGLHARSIIQYAHRLKSIKTKLDKNNNRDKNRDSEDGHNRTYTKSEIMTWYVMKYHHIVMIINIWLNKSYYTATEISCIFVNKSLLRLYRGV